MWYIYISFTDHPLPPIISVQSIGAGSVNISWNSSKLMGVKQNYSIIIKDVALSEDVTITETVHPHYIFSGEMFAVMCDMFVVSVKAVNGAGVSDPSNNVTFVLPSLPDIAPVTASLRHQVWKYDKEIVAMVSFEVHA